MFPNLYLGIIIPRQVTGDLLSLVFQLHFFDLMIVISLISTVLLAEEPSITVFLSDKVVYLSFFFNVEDVV